METNYVPLTEEQAGGCKFPPSCSVYITDDGNKSEVLGHGHVHQCYLQLLPKMEILYEIQFHGDQQKEMISEGHLRFQNGTRVLYQEEEAVVLGMCSLPVDRKMVHNRNYWYTIELEPATGIIHDVDQDDLIFLNTMDSYSEDAIDVAANTKENYTRSAETKLNSGYDQHRDDESADHLFLQEKSEVEAEKENIQDSQVQISLGEQEDNFDSLYGHDIAVEKVDKKKMHQVEISDKDSETSNETCSEGIDKESLDKSDATKERESLLVCVPCSPLKYSDPSSSSSDIVPPVVPINSSDPKKRLRTDESEVYDLSDRKRRVSNDSYEEIIQRKNPKHMDIFLPYQKNVEEVLKDEGTCAEIPSIFDGIKENRVCILYHVRGSCNTPTCDFYHGTCGEDMMMKLLSWCQQVLPIKNKHQKETKVVNPDYNQELFQSFTYTFPKILAAFKDASSFSEWETSTICYQFHVQGYCTMSCSKTQNHVKLDEDQINNIFMWCLTHSPLDTAEGLL